MDVGVPVLAGAIATIIFAVSTLPMVVKAARTKDLRSYSRSNILLANVGNVVHSVYVFSLPMGPIWALHGFYLTTTALMLFWYVRYGAVASAEQVATAPRGRRHAYTELPTPSRREELVISPEAADVAQLLASRP